MKKLLTLLFVAWSLTGALHAQVYPSGDWKRVEPSVHGFDARKLDQARRFMIDSMYTTGCIIIVGGESIFQFGDLTRLSYIASVRKSVLAMLMGKYVEDGTINLDETVGELIADHVIPDDVQKLMPVEKQATIRHLITCRSGVFHDASNDGDDERKPRRGTKQPGEFFLYNNWDFNAAGAIFEGLVGRSIYEVFLDDIAIPTGMQDYKLSNQRKTGDLSLSKYPAYHFHLSTRDMARIGYLMLRDGKWEDQQVISSAWVKESTTPVSTRREVNAIRPSRDVFSYSYMWWNFDVDRQVPALKGAYTGWGFMGQYITIIPELDMVIAHKTDSVYARRTSFEAYYAFLRMIVNAKR